MTEKQLISQQLKNKEFSFHVFAYNSPLFDPNDPENCSVWVTASDEQNAIAQSKELVNRKCYIVREINEHA